MLINESLEFLDKLELISSNKDKESLLRSFDNPILRDLLYRTYNPFLVYHIKQVPTVKGLQGLTDREWDNNYRYLRAVLDSLSQQMVSGSEMKDLVADLLSKCTPLEQKWYTRIIRKDLNIGIKASTINKAMPGLIPVFSPMLAEPIRSYPKLFRLEPKLDGVRTISNTSTSSMSSRKGKGITGYEEIQEELKRLPKGFIVDAEIMNGNFNNLMTSIMSKSTGKVGVLNVIDVITTEEFDAGQSKGYYEENMARADEIISSIHSNLIVRIPHSEIINTSDQDWLTKVEDYYKMCLAQGYEGVMVKDLSSKYECKRTYGWQKLKPVNTYDVLVTGVEEGGEDTKYINSTGKLVCLYEGTEVRVGSGLSDNQRTMYWNDPTTIVGKYIEIMGQEVTDNQSGTHSIRFPRFKRIRADK